MAEPSSQSVASIQKLLIDFAFSKQRRGTVTVTVQPNDDPEAYGMNLLFPDTPSKEFLGFPACHARLGSAAGASGYASMYGWTQVFRCVQSDSNEVKLSEADEWEMDPIPLTSDLNLPFAWFGPEPSLFDLPARPRHLQVDWICRSFLSVIGDCLLTKHVHPVLGFEWGFRMDKGEVHVKPVRQLHSSAWDEHLELLRAKYPGWTFHSHGESKEDSK